MKIANEKTLQVGKYFTGTGYVFGWLTQSRLITRVSTHRITFTDADGKEGRYCDRKSARYVGDTAEEVAAFAAWFNDRCEQDRKEVNQFKATLDQAFNSEVRAKLEKEPEQA